MILSLLHDPVKVILIRSFQQVERSRIHTGSFHTILSLLVVPSQKSASNQQWHVRNGLDSLPFLNPSQEILTVAINSWTRVIVVQSFNQRPDNNWGIFYCVNLFFLRKSPLSLPYHLSVPIMIHTSRTGMELALAANNFALSIYGAGKANYMYIKICSKASST